MNLTHKEIKSIESSLPAYIFDINVFEKNVSQFRSVMGGNISLCYSVKANPWLTSNALKITDSIEVCSVGELEICTALGGDSSMIISGGISRNLEDFIHALSKGVQRFSIESPRQFNLLNDACCSLGMTSSVLLRLTNNNQFGMTVDEALNLFSKKHYYERIRIKGLHFYPGTQRLSVDKLNHEFSSFLSMLNRLNSFNIEEIEYGAGIGADYFRSSDEHLLLKASAKHVHQLATRYKITVESGRALTADAGVYVTKLVEIKQRDHDIFYIVNGGKNQIPYYGYPLSAFNPPITCVCAHSSEKKNSVTICGAFCNAGDVLAKNILVPTASEGDFIVFHRAGAYSVTEGTALFLSRDLPSVYAIKNGEFTLMRGLRPTFDLNLSQYT